MEESDYCFVMRKRIQFFKQKYDPFDRYAEREKSSPEIRIPEKPKIIKQKASAVYSYVLSFLF